MSGCRYVPDLRCIVGKLYLDVITALIRRHRHD